MRCANCGEAGARIERTVRTYGRGEDLLVIENVPVVRCPHCHESYVTARTLHAIDRIRLRRRKRPTPKPINAARFG